MDFLHSLADLEVFEWVEPITVRAQVGDTVVLNCNPPDGLPETSLSSIYWTKGDLGPGEPNSPVHYNERVLADGDGNLFFANVQEEDAKQYMCNAFNTFNHELKVSPVISLVVTGNTSNPAPRRPPTWVYKPPSSLEVLRTKKLKLKCIAEGK